MVATMSQGKLVLYIASSLDGYIATEKHNLDWLFAAEGEGDNGFAKFYDMVDTVLLGRVTYEWILRHETGVFPYQGKECYVFSRTKRENNAFVTFVHEEVVPFVENLKNKDGRTIWLVSGGELLRTFLDANLVDELIVTVAPVLLGRGIPLFRTHDFQTRLSLESINRYGQFVELHYHVLSE